MSNYIFDNAAPQAGQRLTSLETLYDPWTIRHLTDEEVDQVLTLLDDPNFAVSSLIMFNARGQRRQAEEER